MLYFLLVAFGVFQVENAQNCCLGHFQQGGDAEALVETTLSWSCVDCNCKDIDDKDADGCSAAATCCQGHNGVGGDETTLYDPDLYWSCQSCNCKDLDDRASYGCSSPTQDCGDWLVTMSKGSYGNYDIGSTAFNRLFQDSSNHIIRRECSSCLSSHQDIYYRRFTSPATFEPYSYMVDFWSSGNNNLVNGDFQLYSTLADALADQNRWTYCNYNDFGIGFPRDCGPTGNIGGQWNTFNSGRGGQANVQYSLYYPDGNNCNRLGCGYEYRLCLDDQ